MYDKMKPKFIALLDKENDIGVYKLADEYKAYQNHGPR